MRMFEVQPKTAVQSLIYVAESFDLTLIHESLVILKSPVDSPSSIETFNRPIIQLHWNNCH